LTTEARIGPKPVVPDILDGMTGVLIRVVLLDDGRAKEVSGLDCSLHHETGHFFASVRMVLDTLVGIWSDVTSLEAAPLRSWTARCGAYWLVGAGDRAWVLDPAQADIGAVLRRLEAL
jgi:roadblock/LC7 domain-containing protein